MVFNFALAVSVTWEHAKSCSGWTIEMFERTSHWEEPAAEMELSTSSMAGLQVSEACCIAYCVEMGDNKKLDAIYHSMS